jgi:membrane-bound lytic murein transglycosylase B
MARARLAFAVAALTCAAPTIDAVAQTGAPAGASAPAPIEAAPFQDWLAGFKSEATAAGVDMRVIDENFASIDMIPRVFELNDNQPEFSRAVWDYLDGAVSETRIANGRAKFAEHKALLTEIESRYGVDAATIAAIWGMESSYGAIMGDYDALSALATLGWKGRRVAYGRSQLIGALKIIQNGYATRAMLRGSWAGAMGHTQFIPTTYLTYAIDHDGDGRRDLWSNLGDVFASTANYLAASGKKNVEPWGFEVILPTPFDYALADVDIRKPLVEWSAAGVRGARGDLLAGLDPNLQGRILVPAGARGPAFVVFGNFDAILKYNNSTAYALGVALLSDEIAGRGHPIIAGWPRGDRPLTLDERKRLQQALKDRGFDPGPVDGVIGAGTRRALRAWQQSRGLPADAYASAATLDLMLADELAVQAAARASKLPSGIVVPPGGATVDLVVYVDAKGVVRKWRVKKSSGVAAIDAAAIKDARATTFKPPLKHGRPVAAWNTVSVRFAPRPQ